MKINKISNHIYKAEFWLWWKMSAWFVVKDNRVILIDTGMSFIVNKLYKEAAKYGTVEAAFLTHGHSDHAGGINYLSHKYNLPVFINPEDILYTEGAKPFPGRKKCSQIVQPGILKSYDENNRAGAELLAEMGMTLYHTPGHSPGHTVFYHKSDDVMAAGDLFTSKNGVLTPPMKQFTADMELALQSGVEIIKKLRPQKITLCHSNDVVLPYEDEKMKNL